MWGTSNAESSLELGALVRCLAREQKSSLGGLISLTSFIKLLHTKSVAVRCWSCVAAEGAGKACCELDNGKSEVFVEDSARQGML
jgi:hypothetical protein